MKLFAGYLTILRTQVMCDEFSQCYDDVNVCLWTNGSELTQSDAQTACQQRDNSFLPRVTNSTIQSKLTEFRSAAANHSSSRLLYGRGFWIGVTAASINNFHWIDGSQLAGWLYRCWSTVKYIGVNVTVSHMVDVGGTDHAVMDVFFA